MESLADIVGSTASVHLLCRCQKIKERECAVLSKHKVHKVGFRLQYTSAELKFSTQCAVNLVFNYQV